MRILIFFLFFASAYSAVSQDIVFEKSTALRRGLTDKREALPITDPQTGVTSLFLIDNSNISAIVFDNDSLSEQYFAPRPSENASDVLGYITNPGKHHVVFSNKSHTSFTFASLDYAKGVITAKVSEVNIRKERFACAASYANRFFVLTVVKGTSILKLYIFENEQVHVVKTFSFEGKRFMPRPDITLDAALESGGEFQYIDNTVPNPVDLTRKKNKLYCFDNKMLITLDNLPQYTATIAIDLESYSSDLRFYSQSPLVCKEFGKVNSNSYVYRNALYQLNVCTSAMAFTILDLETGKDLQKYAITKEDEITFKNTPIMQEGSRNMFGPDERELSKTKQFMRKVANGEPGISAYSNQDGIQVTLGSVEEFQGGGAPVGVPGMGVGMMVGPGGGIPVSLGYNPVYNSFNSYSFSISVYFKSLLDNTTFEHKTGPVHDNVFDRIDKFVGSMEDGKWFSSKNKEGEKQIAQTVFKADQNFFLGYYDKKRGKYVLRLFKE
jgi:hypothetical protein